MDVDRLTRGELVAAASGLVLLILMFAFSWYGIKDAPSDLGGINAWEAYDFIDLVLLVTVVVAIGTAVAGALAQTVALPITANAITAVSYTHLTLPTN